MSILLGENREQPLTFRDEYRLMKKLESTSAWYNPCRPGEESGKYNGRKLRPETIYIGEESQTPTWEIPVFDVNRYRQAKSLFREGKIDSDNLTFSPWLGEWENLAGEVLQQIKQRDNQDYASDEERQEAHIIMPSYRYAGGGVVQSADNTAVKVVQILAEVLGRDTREYQLTNAVTTVATPNLTLSVDVWSGFSASENVGEGVEPFVKKGKLARTEYSLQKNVAHIAITDEAQMRTGPDRNIFTLHVNHAVQDMRRLKAQSIATTLESATDASGSDWAAYTTDHSTADPIDQLGTLADTIEANGGNPNTIASHARVLRDFSANTHVAGTVAANPGLTFGNRTVNGVPGLPQITWYVDNLLTATIATIYDKAGVVLMQGPVRTAQYRQEGAGVDLYITREWCAPHILDAGLIRNLTGVSA